MDLPPFSLKVCVIFMSPRSCKTFNARSIVLVPVSVFSARYLIDGKHRPVSALWQSAKASMVIFCVADNPVCRQAHPIISRLIISPGNKKSPVLGRCTRDQPESPGKHDRRRCSPKTGLCVLACRSVGEADVFNTTTTPPVQVLNSSMLPEISIDPDQLSLITPIGGPDSLLLMRWRSFILT